MVSSTPLSSSSELIAESSNGVSGSPKGGCSGRKLTIVPGDEFESSRSSGAKIPIDDSGKGVGPRSGVFGRDGVLVGEETI